MIAEGLAKHFGNPTLSDVEFLVGSAKKSIRAHRLVLGSLSPVFKAILYNDDEKEIITFMQVDLPDDDPDTFKQMLKVLYKDETSLNSDEEATKLAQMSLKYSADGAFDVAKKYLEEKITMKNFTTYIPEIMKALKCCPSFGESFIGNHITEILVPSYFSELSQESAVNVLRADVYAAEMLFYTAAVAWGKAECKRKDLELGSLAEVIRDLLTFVRFPLISFKDLSTVVAPSKLLPQDDMYQLLRYCTDPTCTYTLRYSTKFRGVSSILWLRLESEDDLAIESTLYGPESEYNNDEDAELLLDNSPFFLKKIRAWADQYVVGLEFEYVSEHNGSFKSQTCKSSTAVGTESVLVLEDDEFVTGLSGRTGSWCDTLTFTTSKGRSVRFGSSEGGSAFTAEVPKGHVVPLLTVHWNDSYVTGVEPFFLPQPKH